ncbi:MAG: serine dehydratase subunit alpha family protein [Ruminococcaceae bacterium]|nr:serine dehydratase subunit alpha family protein [Oscillospiraceae bacterium]
MEKKSQEYSAYVEILKRELVPARGCTEPTALALCAAKAREVLGELPKRIDVAASGNIIKNVKSVIVPNTDSRKGIEAALAIGTVAGDPSLGLEVLRDVTPDKKKEFVKYLENTEMTVRQADNDLLLDIVVTAYSDKSSAKVRISGTHTNFVYIEKDSKVIFEKEIEDAEVSDGPDYSLLTVEKICDFADSADILDVESVLDRQISYNSAISDEGLAGDYGANIGSVLLKSFGNDIITRAKARAAAGSDARMNGCELPVIINSGSGNQGMTVSLPLIEYAKELGCDKEKLYRALIISNLCAIHLKSGIGCLSAYCGAVSAGAAAGAGIAYLRGGGYREIAHTLVNALAVTSGIVCDGAKASCAAKISTAVDAGILGYEMYVNGQQFYRGDGIVSAGVENTIKNIGRLGRDGMRDTDREILNIMTCVD